MDYPSFTLLQLQEASISALKTAFGQKSALCSISEVKFLSSRESPIFFSRIDLDLMSNSLTLTPLQKVTDSGPLHFIQKDAADQAL